MDESEDAPVQPTGSKKRIKFIDSEDEEEKGKEEKAAKNKSNAKPANAPKPPAKKAATKPRARKTSSDSEDEVSVSAEG